MGRNNTPTNLLDHVKDLERRLRDLETRGGVIEHPFTGERVKGRKITNGNGAILQVITTEGGLEAPGSNAQLVSPANIYQLSTPVDEWEIMYQANFSGVLADAVEIDTLAQLASPIGTTYDFKLQVYTDAGFGTESPVHSVTSTTANTLVIGAWRWRHGLTLDASAKWGINILGRCDSLANTRFDMNKPRFATQRGADMMGVDPLNPFVPS